MSTPREKEETEWKPEQFYIYDPTGKDKRHGWFIGEMREGLSFDQVDCICKAHNASLPSGSDKKE